MKYILTIILFLPLPLAATAKPIEVWECKDRFSGSAAPIIVIATVNKGRKIGTIKVAGIKHNTDFSIDGFNRRWDFELGEDNIYNYAFLIKPNGSGQYYDFSSRKKETKPSMLMDCLIELKAPIKAPIKAPLRIHSIFSSGELLRAIHVAEGNSCSVISSESEHYEGGRKYVKFICQDGTQKEVMCENDQCVIN